MGTFLQGGSLHSVTRRLSQLFTYLLQPGTLISTVTDAALTGAQPSVPEAVLTQTDWGAGGEAGSKKKRRPEQIFWFKRWDKHSHTHTHWISWVIFPSVKAC